MFTFALLCCYLTRYLLVAEAIAFQADMCVELIEVCYFGPTSRFYLAPERRPSENGSNTSGIPNSVTALSPSPHQHQLQFEEKSDGDWLKSNSMLQKSWERLAFANVQHDNSIDPELSAVLLQVYWTWQHPLHHCVYRPCM